MTKNLENLRLEREIKNLENRIFSLLAFRELTNRFSDGSNHFISNFEMKDIDFEIGILQSLVDDLKDELELK